MSISWTVHKRAKFDFWRAGKFGEAPDVSWNIFDDTLRKPLFLVVTAIVESLEVGKSLAYM